MPKLEVSVLIKRPKSEVYKVMKNLEAFPSFMRDVKSLKIIERLPDKIVTLWETEIDGAPLKWKEEDYFDDANCRLKFNMREGDYAEYAGEWLARDYRNGTKLTLKAKFDWGIPILENYVSKKLENEARRGLMGMLLAIKNKVEKPDV